MLHESADRSSAQRAFRGEPVLKWTLERIYRSRHVESAGIVCWEDQLPRVAGIAQEVEACVLAKGPRLHIPQVEGVSAARRWADGWRGGLVSSCSFDLGFYAPWVLELANGLQSDCVVLVDPAAALVDPELLDSLIDHADAHPDSEICFAPAAPGLSGALLRRPLLERLAAARTHPGRLLHYHPDHVSREMLAGDNCAPIPTAVARTTLRFTLDSDRQIARISQATDCLNGQLISSGAEELVRRMRQAEWSDPLPRELVLEINTSRDSKPIFWPGRSQPIERQLLTAAAAEPLLRELGSMDDARLSIGGVGDPLTSPHFFSILDVAQSSGIGAIAVETDFLAERGEDVARLAQSSVDAVSVLLPATTVETYSQVMGVDGYARVLENIRIFLAERQQRNRGLPLLVPILIKCRENLGEMEAWYDQWLRILGCAVIRGPSTFGGVAQDVSVADMAPPSRHPCVRLASRISMLSDGRLVSCEEDVLGRQEMGRLGRDSLREVWEKSARPLRQSHELKAWGDHPTCAQCSEWHRP